MKLDTLIEGYGSEGAGGGGEGEGGSKCMNHNLIMSKY